MKYLLIALMFLSGCKVTGGLEFGLATIIPHQASTTYIFKSGINRLVLNGVPDEFDFGDSVIVCKKLKQDTCIR